MTAGAIVFAENSIVPVVVVALVVIMLYVTLRQISTANRRDGRLDRTPNDTAPYVSSSSDPGGATGILRPAPTSAADDSAPIDMMHGDSPAANAAEDEDSAPNIAIKTYNFRTFDADTGPPDPNTFYDELIVELYDEKTGRVWITSYFITTPSGLSKLMRDEHWNAMFTDNHIVVPRYDRDAVLDAILRQMNNMWQSEERGPRSSKP
jgi:hypothetical protein